MCDAQTCRETSVRSEFSSLSRARMVELHSSKRRKPRATMTITSHCSRAASLAALKAMGSAYSPVAYTSNTLGRVAMAWVQRQKTAVTAWANSYYVGYAPVMTVAFALLIVAPSPALKDGSTCSNADYVHWRRTALADALAQLLYVFFGLAAAYDSTWARSSVPNGITPWCARSRVRALPQPGDHATRGGLPQNRKKLWLPRQDARLRPLAPAVRRVQRVDPTT